MKNTTILLVLLLAAAASVLLTSCKGNLGNLIGPDEPSATRTDPEPPGGDPLLFENFCFQTQGMSAEAEVVEGIKTPDGGLTLSYYLHRSYYDGENDVDEKNIIAEITGDSAFYEEISALLGSYRVMEWDGFSGPNPPGVLDGESGGFEAKLTDGGTISAHGSNNFPKNFSFLMRKLRERLQYEEITGTHLELTQYAVDIPESWAGVMTLYRGAGYVAFETELDGGLKATLIIDNDTYGYSDSYDNAFLAGRLLKDGEKPRFITVRESYEMKYFEASLTEAQKAVSTDFQRAREAITASITGINGWTFMPEDGSTLYESQARKLFDSARSLWLNLCLAGEYAGGASPETIDGKTYRAAYNSYSGVRIRNEEELRAEMEEYFSKDFTEEFIAAHLADKSLLFRDNTMYVSFDKIADPLRYGGFYVKEVSNDSILVEVRKALPTDEEYRYSQTEEIVFPVLRNEEGNFVFTDFPYWDKAD